MIKTRFFVNQGTKNCQTNLSSLSRSSTLSSEMSSNTNPAIPATCHEKHVANPSARLVDESNTANKTPSQKHAIEKAKKAEEVKKAAAALSIHIDPTDNVGLLIPPSPVPPPSPSKHNAEEANLSSVSKDSEASDSGEESDIQPRRHE